ncbi:MAG: nucleoside-diphosphate kinase [Candidatus Peribacteria bacterium]|jgi:nucleoside-diphosphate kinase|nr:nucleoside-diphosphate kinase [Candidatus Peribacteria bacterium]
MFISDFYLNYFLSMSSQIERSLVVFKPDAVSRAVVGEILSRFEKRGLNIIGMKMLKPNKEFFYHHYETIGKMISRRGEKPFALTLAFMQMTPVIAVVFEGVDATKVIRQMVGTTDPQAALPGTVRGDYSYVALEYSNDHERGVMNLLHASGNAEEAQQEIAHWFKPEELFSYERADQTFMY